MSRPLYLWIWAFVLSGLATACGSNYVRLEPMHVKATVQPDKIEIEAYDANVLFSRALKFQKDQKYQSALEQYEKIVKEFGDSELIPLSLFNSGLCFMQLEQYEQAAKAYRVILDRYPDYEDQRDTLFQLAGVYERLEAWDNAISIFDILLYQEPTIKGINKVEALARKGSALINVKRMDDAELILQEATRRYRLGKDISPSDSSYHYAMAHFKLGEITHEEMRGIELPSTEDVLQRELERKCQLLLDAQGRYTRAIRVGNMHWASAAAYRIGALYRNLWNDMLDAPPPPGFDAEEQEIYKDVLKDQVRILLQKAVVQWERTLKLANRFNLSNDWIERTASDLEAIRKILAFKAEADD